MSALLCRRLPVSRLEPQVNQEEPATLTPMELHANDLQRFENFERYTEQSAATRDGVVAELPKRKPLR